MTICNIQTKKNVQWNDIGTLIPKQQLKQLQQRHRTDHPNDGGGPPTTTPPVDVLLVVVAVVLGDDDGEVYPDDNDVEAVRRLLLDGILRVLHSSNSNRKCHRYFVSWLCMF